MGLFVGGNCWGTWEPQSGLWGLVFCGIQLGVMNCVTDSATGLLSVVSKLALKNKTQQKKPYGFR